MDESTGGDFAIHRPGSLKMSSKREYAEPGPIVKKCQYKSNNFVMFWNHHSVARGATGSYIIVKNFQVEAAAAIDSIARQKNAENVAVNTFNN